MHTRSSATTEKERVSCACHRLSNRSRNLMNAADVVQLDYTHAQSCSDTISSESAT